jgi:hypothetical protein
MVRVAVVLSGHILDATVLVFYFLDNLLHGFAEELPFTYRQWVELIWHEGLGRYGGAGLGEHLVVLGVGVVFLEHDCKEVLVGFFFSVCSSLVSPFPYILKIFGLTFGSTTTLARRK